MIDPYCLMPSFLIALIWLIEDYFEDKQECEVK